MGLASGEEGSVRTGLVYLRPVRVAFARVRGPYAASAPEAWAKIFDWLDARNGRREVTRGFGLAHDDPRIVAKENLRYDACVEMPPDLELQACRTFGVQMLPGGAYARQRYVGPHSGIRQEFHDMRTNWAPARGLALDARRPFIEIYLDDPTRCPPEKLRTDLCIPVVVASEVDAA